jgi:hypothetical protein
VIEHATLTAIRAIATAATPGARGWFGFMTTRSLYLATQRHGRKVILSFTRWGASGERAAQPRFRDSEGRLRDASELALLDADHAIIGIDNPDARFMEHITPDVVISLCDEIDALRARLAEHVPPCE